jgi:AraC family transcriptional regulator
MEAKIVELPKLYFIGLKIEVKMDEIDQAGPVLWSKLMSQAQDLDDNPDLMCLGVCLTKENCSENDTFTYMAGFASDKALACKDGFISHEITACKYAVFTHKGSIMNVGKTYDFAYKTWIPNSEHQLLHHEDLELYDNRFDENNPENSEMDIFIPIK